MSEGVSVNDGPGVPPIPPESSQRDVEYFRRFPTGGTVYVQDQAEQDDVETT